jgi:integrase
LIKAGAQGPPQAVGALTVAELVRLYLGDAAGRVKPRTLEWLRGFLAPFAERHGGLPAAGLTPPLAESYSRQPSWSPSTRHDFLGVLAGAVRWALRSRLLDRNPLDGVRRPPKESRGEAALLGPDELGRLLDAAAPHFRVYLEVLYLSGARPGEVAAIGSDNFDPAAGVVKLEEHKTRHATGRARVILLPPRAVELLLGQRERYPTGPLLRNRCGRPWTVWALVKAMQAVRARAGMPKAVCYSLRHVFVTDCIAAGLSDSVTAELAGHASTGMIRNYNHVAARRQALRDALAKVRGDAPPPPA